MANEFSLIPFMDAVAKVGQTPITDLDSLAKAALAMYLDLNTPQDSGAATYCKMGDPKHCPPEAMNAASAIYSWLESRKPNGPVLQDADLGEAIAGLEKVKNFLSDLDMVGYTDFSTAAMGMAGFDPEYYDRPDIVSVHFLGMSLDDKNRIKGEILDALVRLIIDAEESRKARTLPVAARPALPAAGGIEPPPEPV